MCQQTENHVQKYSTIFYAGGGTAGHVYPLLGLVEYAPSIQHILLTDARGERYATGFDQVHVPEVKRANWSTFITSVFHAIRLIKQYNPRCLITTGCYSSVPVVIACRIKGIPIVVIETNAIVGQANKFACLFTKHKLSSFDIPGFIRIGYLARTQFYDKRQTKQQDMRTIVIFGSSIGSEFFAKVMPDVLHGQNLRIVHQAPVQYHAHLRECYGPSAIVSDFFADIYTYIQSADIVVCRAGAGTIAELALMQVPCVLVPSPNVKHDHQSKNAHAAVANFLPEADCSIDNLRSAIEHAKAIPLHDDTDARKLVYEYLYEQGLLARI